jgi:uncharacterized membrane protein
MPPVNADLLYVLTLLAALGSGLMAGVFFAFSAFVMRALAQLAPPHGMAAMQAINVAVLNPVFLGTFIGTALLSAVLLAVWVADRGPTGLLAGALLYLVGTFLVTILFNVPRNEAIAKLDPTSPEAAPSWSAYLSTWTGWNHVRTASALAAAAAFTVSLR